MKMVQLIHIRRLIVKSFNMLLVSLITLVVSAHFCVAKDPKIPTRSTWTQKEAVLSEFVKMRMKVLEKDGFAFGKNFVPKVKLLPQLDPSFDGGKNYAEYFCEDRCINFSYEYFLEVQSRYTEDIGLMNAAELLDDKNLGERTDHELGHFWSDMSAREHGLAPYYTAKDYLKLDYDERLGLKVVSEGIAVYFQYLHHPFPKEVKLSEECFPANFAEEKNYPFFTIAYDGGYWMVKDIIQQHGERGIVWILRHPLVVRDGNMRRAAIVYRNQALRELKLSAPKKKSLRKRDIRGLIPSFFI